MTEAQIKFMVDRFLAWRLPEPWHPDNGISYQRPNYHPDMTPEAMHHHYPVGTNLFDDGQATDMVRHMIDGVMAVDSDPVKSSATEYAWLIEAPGPHYLAAREMGGWTFYWTKEHDKAIRFHSQQQADAVMMAVRALNAGLFEFARTLTDAKPVEHGWMAAA